MKKYITIYLTFFIVIVIYNAESQNQIPNSGFEDWNSQTSIKSWNTTNSFGEMFGFTPVMRTEDKHSGQYAIKLSSIDTYGGPSLPGVACLGTLGMNQVSGGIAFSGKPEKLSGYLKHPTDGDTAWIIIELLKKKNDSVDNIGIGKYYITGQKKDFGYFECPIVYYSNDIPDMLNIILLTSNNPGSTLIVDDLALNEKPSDVKDEHKDEPEIPLVYPNPATSTINFAFGSKKIKQIEIFDAGMKQTGVFNINNEFYSMNTREWAPGYYFYKIKTEHSELTGKFILLK